VTTGVLPSGLVTHQLPLTSILEKLLLKLTLETGTEITPCITLVPVCEKLTPVGSVNTLE
jgi:hypothetical protein